VMRRQWIPSLFGHGKIRHTGGNRHPGDGQRPSYRWKTVSRWMVRGAPADEDWIPAGAGMTESKQIV